MTEFDRSHSMSHHTDETRPETPKSKESKYDFGKEGHSNQHLERILSFDQFEKKFGKCKSPNFKIDTPKKPNKVSKKAYFKFKVTMDEQNSENLNTLQNFESLIRSCVSNVCNNGDQNQFEFKISFGSEQDLRVLKQNCQKTSSINKMNKHNADFKLKKVRLLFPFFFQINQISVY